MLVSTGVRAYVWALDRLQILTGNEGLVKRTEPSCFLACRIGLNSVILNDRERL